MQEQDLPVAQAYAEALLESTRQAGTTDQALDEARALRDVLKRHPDTTRLLARPALRREDKEGFLRRVFADRLSKPMFHLALLLVRKHRGGLWDDVLKTFIERVERERGIFVAKVRTAHELPDDQKRALATCLEAYTGHQLRVEFRRDEALLGGVLVRHGDLMIDATLRGALERLRDRLDDTELAPLPAGPGDSPTAEPPTTNAP